MSRVPFASLKLPVVAALAAFSIAGAAIYWSFGLYREAADALERAQLANAAAQAREAQGQRDAHLIAQHLDGYRAMAAQGLGNAETRLAWIEAVHLANRDVRLYGVTYTLSPREAAPAAVAGDIPLMQTKMLLRMPLLVETDLQRFLNALKGRAQTAFRVSECRLSRTADTAFKPANVPELEAECELLWFTLGPVNEEVR
jgi:hypothetical protein